MHGTFALGFSTGTNVRIAREYGCRLEWSDWPCTLKSQAKKYVADMFPTLYIQQSHPWALARLYLKFLLKDKALIPHLKFNRAKLCMDFFSPSKWSLCPFVIISPSTFIFIRLYCFKSIQNVVNVIYLRKNNSELISNLYGTSLASAVKFQST